MADFFETIDAAELAKRLNLPVTWIRDQVRTRAQDKIPHLKFGHYVRFEWLHPDLMAWIERRRSGRRQEAKQERVYTHRELYAANASDCQWCGSTFVNLGALLYHQKNDCARRPE